MQWQDLVLSGAAFVVTLSLIPTILGKDKPALATSILTTTVIALVSFAFATLHLWAAALTNGLASAAWLVLALQKFRQNKK